MSLTPICESAKVAFLKPCICLTRLLIAAAAEDQINDSDIKALDAKPVSMRNDLPQCRQMVLPPMRRLCVVLAFSDPTNSSPGNRTHSCRLVVCPLASRPPGSRDAGNSFSVSRGTRFRGSWKLLPSSLLLSRRCSPSRTSFRVSDFQEQQGQRRVQLILPNPPFCSRRAFKTIKHYDNLWRRPRWLFPRRTLVTSTGLPDNSGAPRVQSTLPCSHQKLEVDILKIAQHTQPPDRSHLTS